MVGRMRCRTCGHENRPGRRFCAECGARVALACPACGDENEAGDKFCGACGRALDASGPTEKTLTARSAIEGERKQVTVLFADLKGSMELAEQLDAEEWSAVMQRFFRILAAGVERFGGFVDKFTGDGIMAIFGAPIAYEDHAERACHAALHLRDTLKAHADTLRAERHLDFSVRMGLNSGEVVGGRVGDSERMEYTAQGHTVGLASRMENLAAPGHILVTEHTAALVAGLFDLADLGPRTVKGVRAPMRVFDLRGLGHLRSRLDVLRNRRASKFVGREAEMAALDEALAEMLAGRGRIVGITAPAGVGKTRLCFEFVERCREQGLTVFEAHCPAHARILPFQLLQQLARAYCNVDAQDGDETTRAKVEATLHEEGRLDGLPLLLELLGLADRAPTAAGVDPEVWQRQLFSLMRQVAARRSSTEPVVVLIDDMQWIDAGSESYFADIAPITGMRLLMVVNFRPEYQPPWGGRSFYLPITLRPFGPEVVWKMLAYLLGPDASLAGVVELIGQRTGGNAFFVEEVVQSLVEGGYLAGTRGHYRLVRDVADIRLPATVEVVLAARIDRLPARAKDVLQAAAVIGKEFPRPILLHVTALDAPELGAALARLEEAELVYQTSGDEWAFHHPLTQEVAYREQLTDRRATVHTAVARAIETLAPELEEHYATLAHHWARSHERERAVDYFARAGDKARAVFSLAMARQQYAPGLELLDALEATPARMAKRVEMTLAFAEAGLYAPSPQHVEALRRARACAEQIGDRGGQHRCTYWIGWLEYALGNVDSAIAAFRQCIEVATAVRHRGLLGQVYCNLGCAYTEAAEYETALDFYRNGIGMREGGGSQAPDSVVVAYALGLLGVALGDMGQFDDAFARIREGLDMLERLGVRSQQASILQTVTWVQLYRGGWTECIAAASRARALAERVGAPYIIDTNLSFEGYARFHAGERARGLKLLLESTERLEGLQAFLSMSISLGCCAEALALSGDVVRARAYAERTFGRVAARESQGEAMAHRALAIAAGVERDESRMHHHYDAAMAAAARKWSPRDAALTDFRFGEALARLDRTAEAHGHLVRARAAFERLGMDWYRERADAALAGAREEPPAQASN
jgi:class 3 adenylate cyclase/tetratricopeptide (TPR) repeat protein